MKAADYIAKFRQYTADPQSMWDGETEIDPKVTATQQVCLDMVDEMLDLVKLRRISEGGSIAAVIREQDQKWGAILSRLNNPKISRLAFLDMLKEVNPELRDAYDEFTLCRMVA